MKKLSKNLLLIMLLGSNASIKSTIEYKIMNIDNENITHTTVPDYFADNNYKSKISTAEIIQLNERIKKVNDANLRGESPRDKSESKTEVIKYIRDGHVAAIKILAGLCELRNIMGYANDLRNFKITPQIINQGFGKLSSIYCNEIAKVKCELNDLINRYLISDIDDEFEQFLEPTNEIVDSNQYEFMEILIAFSEYFGFHIPVTPVLIADFKIIDKKQIWSTIDKIAITCATYNEMLTKGMLYSEAFDTQIAEKFGKTNNRNKKNRRRRLIDNMDSTRERFGDAYVEMQDKFNNTFVLSFFGIEPELSCKTLYDIMCSNSCFNPLEFRFSPIPSALHSEVAHSKHFFAYFGRNNLQFNLKEEALKLINNSYISTKYEFCSKVDKNKTSDELIRLVHNK